MTVDWQIWLYKRWATNCP